MKNMKYILLLGVPFAFFASCGNKNANTENAQSDDVSVQLYENKYFSIMCPKGWTADWTDYVPDNEDVKRVLDSLKIDGGEVELFAPDRRFGLKIVKSVSAWLNPNGEPRQWCELAMLGSQTEEECVGMTDVRDSLIVAGYPAASVSFAYCHNTIASDTIMQELYAIVPKRQELYYASIKYTRGDEEAHYIGWQMLHTLKLKIEK